MNALKLTICAVAFLLALGVVPPEDVAAAPSQCLFPGTSARALKVIGNGPVACATSSCRTAGTYATKIVPCTGGPACAIGAFYVESWQAQSGAWAGLPACPTWTNTATWQ